MKIDWDVDTSSGGTYDNGAYRVRIESIESVQAKSGNDQLRVKTKFVDGKYEGKQLTDHITLVESCDWKLVKFIKAMGVDVATLGEIGDTNSNAFRNLLNKFVGKTTIWLVGKHTGTDAVERNVINNYQVDPKAEEKSKEEAWLE